MIRFRPSQTGAVAVGWLCFFAVLSPACERSERQRAIEASGEQLRRDIERLDRRMDELRAEQNRRHEENEQRKAKLGDLRAELARIYLAASYLFAVETTSSLDKRLDPRQLRRARCGRALADIDWGDRDALKQAVEICLSDAGQCPSAAAVRDGDGPDCGCQKRFGVPDACAGVPRARDLSPQFERCLRFVKHPANDLPVSALCLDRNRQTLRVAFALGASFWVSEYPPPEEESYYPPNAKDLAACRMDTERKRCVRECDPDYISVEECQVDCEQRWARRHEGVGLDVPDMAQDGSLTEDMIDEGEEEMDEKRRQARVEVCQRQCRQRFPDKARGEAPGKGASEQLESQSPTILEVRTVEPGLYEVELEALGSHPGRRVRLRDRHMHRIIQGLDPVLDASADIALTPLAEAAGDAP